MSYVKENFHLWEPVLGRYAEGNRIAIEYYNKEDGMPECTATVNMPDEQIDADEVIVKNYSEGEGLYECMVEAKHISEALRYVQTGFVSVPVCKLLLEVSK